MNHKTADNTLRQCFLKELKTLCQKSSKSALKTTESNQSEKHHRLVIPEPASFLK